MAAAVIRTIAAAADAGTCALKSPEMDSGEDGGVNVCTDWPVLATNFKGYGSTGKDGRAALGGIDSPTLLPFLSLVHTLIVLPFMLLVEQPLLLTTVATQLFVVTRLVVVQVVLA